MEYLMHWTVTHTAVFIFGVYLGWKQMPKLQEMPKIQAVTKWVSNNIMILLTLKNMIWVAALLTAIANSFVFKKAKGGMRKFKKSLLSIALFLVSTAGDITSFSTKQEDINKDETEKVEEKEKE